ncbi:glycosyltransferase family 4 protein [Cohnella sp. LGH]|uniref:glycosyltransferase family 4 protein n=1 Tax=Cohnella sp. LGH TaxID=1619153 RepID=UPI001ADBA68A|nr:glycosyltransferase family 4 protein [Cohnella sp. LGH]QTH40685.1 glycosyltransferase family 4 protein [Cohnella sp. LGH]
MKVLVVCQYFYPEQFRVNEMCFEMARSGTEVTVLTGLPNYPGGIIHSEYRRFKRRNEKIHGVTVKRVPILGRGRNRITLSLNYLSFAISASIQSLFLRKKFDVIIVYQLSPVTMALPGIILKRLTGKPLILYCHDLWPASASAGGIEEGGILYRFLLTMSRWLYRKSDEIIISSKQFEHYFRHVLGIERKLAYLPVFAESIFEEINLDKGNCEETHFVFAGNIGEMQSVETILYAAKELIDENRIHFHIVGSGTSRKKCQQLAEDLGVVNVTFYGHLSLDELPFFYKMADAMIVTLKANHSLSYTLPNKVQSYMAASKPILGAINGETRRVIEESGCGYCTAAEDYKGLASIIRKFASENNRHEHFRQRARSYYDNHFSKTLFIKRLNKVMQKYG